jgi:hypothetical protein
MPAASDDAGRPARRLCGFPTTPSDCPDHKSHECDRNVAPDPEGHDDARDCIRGWARRGRPKDKGGNEGPVPKHENYDQKVPK